MALWITLALGALGAAPAFADITVTTTSDSATPGDGQCSLREAIALSADCPGAAGGGATTIQVPAGTYTLSDELHVLGGANLVIRGASTSDASQTTINRASDAAQFRLMRIDSGAIVTLDGLALRGGHAPDGSAGGPGTNGLPGNPGVAGGVGTPGGDGTPGSPSGAIANAGTLTIDHALLSDNVAGTGGAGGIGGAGGAGGVGTVASGKQGGVGAFGSAGGDGGAGGNGGAILNTPGASLTVTHSVLDNNAAGAGGTGAPGGAGGDGGAGAPAPNCCGTGAVAGAGGPGGAMGPGGSGGAIYNLGTAVINFSTIRFSRGGMGGSFGISVGFGGQGGKGGDTSAFFNGTGGRGGDGGAAGVGAGGGSGGGIFSTGSLTLGHVTLHNNAAGDGSWAGSGGWAGNGGNGGDAVNGGVAGTAGTAAAGGTAGCGGAGGAIFVGAGPNPNPQLTINTTTIWNNGTGAGGFGGGGGRGGDKGAVGGTGTSSPGAAGGTGGCGGIGAGIAVTAGSAALTNTTIGENRAAPGGTGGNGGNGSAGGSAGGNAGNGGLGGRAGGVFTIRPVSFDAVTITANQYGSGGKGGTVVGSGTPNGNPGSDGAAGLATQIWNNAAVLVSFRNTLVNGPIAGQNCLLAVGPNDLGGNLDYPASPCPGTGANPTLDPLGDYGGPTKTYRLHPGSPAIDGGNDTGCQQTDQRGIARPQGAHCDIGAVESGAPPNCQDVGPVHVPYGTLTTFQLVCSDPVGLPIYDYVGAFPIAQHGQVRVVGERAAGVWSYLPDPGFSGSDSFTYYGSSGNGDSAPRTVTVQVTAPPAAPEVTGASPASPSNVASPKITGSAAAGTTVKLYPTADCTGPALGSGSAADFAGAGVPVGPLTQGTSVFHALATDADGISSTCSTTSATYTYDATGPVVHIDSGPSGPTADRRPVFGFSSPEAGVVFACSIDTGVAAFGPCTGAATHRPAAALGFRRYTFRVRATDAAGNATVATRSFRVAPDTIIVKHPKAKVRLRGLSVGVRFTFRSRPRGAKFRCSLDGARPRACRTPKRYSVKAGRHRFTVRATIGGKTDPTPASFRFRVVPR